MKPRLLAALTVIAALALPSAASAAAGDLGSGVSRNYGSRSWEQSINTGRRFWNRQCEPINIRYGAVAAPNVAYANRSTCTVTVQLSKMRGWNRLTVIALAVHEVGHLTGCGHYSDRRLIMHPLANAAKGRNVQYHFRHRHAPHNSCSATTH